jgi:ubiquinone/menaquinone biosynthesis C-methylase UbiE
MAMAGTDAYGWQSRVYDRVIEPMNRPLRRVARRQVDPPPGGVVLDVGCGTGAALAEWLEEGFEARGSDQSPAMLEQARQRLGDAADLRLTDGPAIPFDDGSADLVLLSLLLHSLSEWEARALLGEVGRVLAPDGRVLVTDFGVAGLRVPRGVATRGVTVLAELAAGAQHARNGREYVRRGGLATLAPPTWSVEREKHTAGGNITVTVLARA